MPHSSQKSKNLGGARRTIICRCGKYIRGHPNQIDGLIKAHMKVCDQAENMLTENANNPFNHSICQSYIQDSRAGDIHTATAVNSADGVERPLCRVVGAGTDYEEISKTDLTERIHKQRNRKSKPPTGKQRRAMKKQGVPPTDSNIIVPEDRDEISQLADDLVKSGYEPSYQFWWKGSASPIVYQDHEVFKSIRSAGKEIAERESVAEIVERLDSIEKLLYHSDFVITEDKDDPNFDALALHTTIFATDIYAFSWITGISGDKEGCLGVYKNEVEKSVVFLKECF